MQVVEQVWTSSELVNVTLTQFDQATHISTAQQSQHQAHCWRMGSDADPGLWVTTTIGPPTEEIAAEFGYGPERVATGNFSDWFDQDTYEASLAASQTADFDERYALYEQVWTTMAEQAVFWYSGHTPFMVATDSNIYGLNGWTLPDGQLGSGILPETNMRFAEAFIVS
jgi:ABC-type transport system substrate-binding protein